MDRRMMTEGSIVSAPIELLTALPASLRALPQRLQ